MIGFNQEAQNDPNTGTQRYYVIHKCDPNQHTRIMRADFHQGDDRFLNFSRNKQYAAVSVVALCHFFGNNNPKTWKTADLNNLLINGDILYQASYKRMKTQKTVPLKLTDILPQIKMGEKVYHLSIIEKLETNVLNWNNLILSLNRFFVEKNHHTGVFTYGIFSFAIMRKADSFFLLNSRATAYDGEPLDPLNRESAACLMEMFTTTCLAERLLVACDERKMMLSTSDDVANNQSSVFVITDVIFVENITGAAHSNRKRMQMEINVESAKRSKRIEERTLKHTRNDSTNTQMEVIFQVMVDPFGYRI